MPLTSFSSGASSWRKTIGETVRALIIALAIILPVRFFLVQPFYVRGASMEPNFHDREYLMIDEISYRFDSPQRGDSIVFRYPEDPKQFFIKRIIGLPSEKVTVKDNSVFIKNKNGEKKLDEGLYLPANLETVGNVTYVLADDEYFVLGDNRMWSKDSREFGPVKKKYIIGRAWLRGWPLNRVGVIEHQPPTLK